MQNTSALYKELLADSKHYFETKLTIDLENNEVATLYEDEIKSINTSNNVFPNGNPQVGFAVSGELDVVIYKQRYTIPRAAKIRPYVRVCVDGVPSGTLAGVAIAGISIVGVGGNGDRKSEWLPKGVYYIDTRKVTVNGNGVDTITIHGYDDMLRFDTPYPSDSQHNYPLLDTTMVTFLAQSIGISVDSRTYEVMTAQYTFPLPVGYTAREVLGYIAGSYGGNFIMSEDGKLRLLKLRDIPKNESMLTAPDGDYLLFGNTRILLFAGGN